MVQDSRTAARPDQLRPLNRPRPTKVIAVDGRPVALAEGSARVRVVEIEDSWHIDDEWWREPVRRRYFRVATETGSVRTLFHDFVSDGWFEQRY